MNYTSSFKEIVNAGWCHWQWWVVCETTACVMLKSNESIVESWGREKLKKLQGNHKKTFLITGSLGTMEISFLGRTLLLVAPISWIIKNVILQLVIPFPSHLGSCLCWLTALEREKVKSQICSGSGKGSAWGVSRNGWLLADWGSLWLFISRSYSLAPKPIIAASTIKIKCLFPPLHSKASNPVNISLYSLPTAPRISSTRFRN